MPIDHTPASSPDQTADQRFEEALKLQQLALQAEERATDHQGQGFATTAAQESIDLANADQALVRAAYDIKAEQDVAETAAGLNHQLPIGEDTHPDDLAAYDPNQN